MSVSSRTATVGQPAPEFSLVDQHGSEFRLAEAVSSGPVVVVFLRGFG
jgi:peroxiredoxin